jgi:hypothetical protein
MYSTSGIATYVLLNLQNQQEKKIPDLSMFSYLFQLIRGGEQSQKMTVS